MKSKDDHTKILVDTNKTAIHGSNGVPLGFLSEVNDYRMTSNLYAYDFINKCMMTVENNKPYWVDENGEKRVRKLLGLDIGNLEQSKFNEIGLTMDLLNDWIGDHLWSDINSEDDIIESSDTENLRFAIINLFEDIKRLKEMLDDSTVIRYPLAPKSNGDNSYDNGYADAVWDKKYFRAARL